MTVETNHSLSVDCVVFGYDAEGLKILLVEQLYEPVGARGAQRLKLPGSMISENETVSDAAQRVLYEKTGLERVYLKQTEIFSDPRRVSGDELEWINRYHNISSNRVVTVGYYALVQISKKIKRYTTSKGARWVEYDSVPQLVMDHNFILRQAYKRLRSDFERSAIAFELLPRKFTIRELQNLYSAVMGVVVDSRNFRKKILSTNMIKPTGERESGVAHKPAEYFTFNTSEFRKSLKRGLRYF